MREAYIVKKSVKRNPLNPKERISLEEYEMLVTKSDKLTWYENTVHGKRHFQQEPDQFNNKTRAYINYDKNDETSWASMLPPIRGYIPIQFDFKSSKKNLIDLIDIAEKIGCNLWQYKPKRQILTHSIAEDRYKKKKPITRQKTFIKPINWLKFKGDLDLFFKVFSIESENITPTISKINKANTSNNSFIILFTKIDEYLILGKGIECLYKLEFKSNNDVELAKFKKRLNALFSNVKLKEFVDTLNSQLIENRIIELVNEAIENKTNLVIGKVRKKLF